jgi:hypothetical protein
MHNFIGRAKNRRLEMIVRTAALEKSVQFWACKRPSVCINRGECKTFRAPEKVFRVEQRVQSLICARFGPNP